MNKQCAIHSRAGRPAARKPVCAFTVLELLVVMSVVVLMASVLMPSLSAARGQARSVNCRSNIAQIILANRYYAQESGGRYVPGASDFHENYHRWHGARNHRSEAFDSSRGPLVPYLGPGGAIRQCPSFPAVQIASAGAGFERSNGGYGYNNAYLGVQLVRGSSGQYAVANDRAGVTMDRVKRPAATIMFADSAFAGSRLVEYSFAEPRFHPWYPTQRMDPSIHFRHNGEAQVGWCDGHVDSYSRTLTWSSGFYPADPEGLGIGWFGQADDNSLFDLR